MVSNYNIFNDNRRACWIYAIYAYIELLESQAIFTTKSEALSNLEAL